LGQPEMSIIRRVSNGFIILFHIVLLHFNCSVQNEKGLLKHACSMKRLRSTLISREEYQPFPTVNDRQSWNSLPVGIQQILVSRGEKGLNYDWPDLPATLFLGYVRTGNRTLYQNQRSARRNMLCGLVIAECVEAEGRFMDDIINGLWTICEESYWGVPAHLGMQKAGSGLPDVREPTVDLFAAETASLLSWTSYLLDFKLDEVSPLIRERIYQELDQRIFTPCLERDDFWWMGFSGEKVNNWNPWCNSNWLTSVLLMEKNDEKRFQAIGKIINSLDHFINIYPDDGGCDEGPGYWNRAGGSLFECLELLHGATDGALDIFDEHLIREIGRYIYRVHIGGNYFINFADASALVNISSNLAYRYGKCIGDDYLTAFASYSAQRDDQGRIVVTGNMSRQLSALFQLF